MELMQQFDFQAQNGRVELEIGPIVLDDREDRVRQVPGLFNEVLQFHLVMLQYELFDF